MWITLRCATSYPHIHRHYYYALAKRGHLYFANKGTFLFGVDRVDLTELICQGFCNMSNLEGGAINGEGGELVGLNILGKIGAGSGSSA
jgi:hypothetical protein